ncbi:MAG: hypothetical protein COU07_01945, partial [Candidatus Harrisonbacteria bacterium CG10_big_fil_rev_8_21_14_0_10_40_38]
MKSDKAFLNGTIAFVIVLVSGLIQNTDILSIGQLKPNLILVVLFALAFFIPSAPFYALLAVLADAIVRFHPFFVRMDFVFLFLVLASYWVSGRLPSKPMFNYVIIITIGTLLLYALASPSFIIKAPVTVFFELIYNNIIGFIIFLV